MMRRREFLYRSTAAVSVAGIASGLACDRSAIAAENELTANGAHAKTPATPSSQEASSDFKLQLELGGHVVGALFAWNRKGEQVMSRILRVREEFKRQKIVFPIVRIADKLSLPATQSRFAAWKFIATGYPNRPPAIPANEKCNRWAFTI